MEPTERLYSQSISLNNVCNSSRENRLMLPWRLICLFLKGMKINNGASVVNTQITVFEDNCDVCYNNETQQPKRKYHGKPYEITFGNFF